MLKKRVLSAAILLPIVVAAVLLGGWPFTILILVAVLAASVEYTQLLQRCGYRLPWPLVAAGIVLWLADAIWHLEPWLAPALALLALGGGTWQLFRRGEAPTATWALTLAGGLYLGLGGAYLIRLRALPDGLWWTLTALPVVWVADSGAYAIGRRWGRHKMAPTISPGKSWEGYAAEVVSGLLAGLCFGWLWPLVAGQPQLTLTPWRGLVLGGLLAVLTPLGDLFESMIKREAGVKDSSNLIPGHGGVFDRIDSLLWTGILAWGYLTLLLA